MDFDVGDNAYRKNWFVMENMIVSTGRMKTAATVRIDLSILIVDSFKLSLVSSRILFFKVILFQIYS
jgi:hypothetical protein